MSASSNNQSVAEKTSTASIGNSLGDTARKAKSAAKRTAKRTIDEVSMTPFLRKIVFFSSGGSFLDGYVLALIGVVLTQITPLFDLTRDMERIDWCFGILGHFDWHRCWWLSYRPYWAPRYVHHRLDSYCGVLDFSVFAADPLSLVIARFFIGVFVGADYPIARQMIAKKFTPTHHRSISMGMVSAAWYLGILRQRLLGIRF